MRKTLVKNALSIWAENIDVKTVSGRTRITQFFTENKSSSGASYWAHHLKNDVSTDGIFDDRKRSGDRGQYCGLFIAYAGLGLIKPDIGYYCLPSTARMVSTAKWRDATADFPDKVDFEDIQPGDIITVVTGKNKSYGDHFALVTDRKGHLLYTVEANTVGLLADGMQGRGVVKRSRYLNQVRCVYRLDERHFLPQGVC